MHSPFLHDEVGPIASAAHQRTQPQPIYVMGPAEKRDPDRSQATMQDADDVWRRAASLLQPTIDGLPQGLTFTLSALDTFEAIRRPRLG
jgi:hypothetical protein